MLIEKHESPLESNSSPAINIEPPPYSLQADSGSTSRSRRPSVLPPLPPDAFPSPKSPATASPIVPGPSFSQIRLDTHFSDITGTYYIDPKPALKQLTNKNKKARRVKATPDAIFHSRNGKILLDLATTGLVSDVPKATVIVASKSGNITLNLLPAGEIRPRFDLEVRSKSGTVVIFIPRTFAGAIQLRTRSADLEYLPAITRQIQVVKATGRESLVLFGKQNTPASQLPSDFCNITTHSGKIVVGLRGEDTYVEELGLWQRLGGLLKGDAGKSSDQLARSRPPSPTPV
ncbi:hypothetical protein C8R46DRAFT_1070300 [Mycena filopes]|nr:hypothetical protein C8R46DRAFT_1070300 [Mycena filopes]